MCKHRAFLDADRLWTKSRNTRDSPPWLRRGDAPKGRGESQALVAKSHIGVV